jgi:hypothetical protein
MLLWQLLALRFRSPIGSDGREDFFYSLSVIFFNRSLTLGTDGSCDSISFGRVEHDFNYTLDHAPEVFHEQLFEA